MSLSKRIEFISRLLKINNNDSFKDVIRIDNLLTFSEWMYENCKQEVPHMEMNPQFKKLLPSFQMNKEKEMEKIQFLARFKPKVKK